MAKKAKKGRIHAEKGRRGKEECAASENWWAEDTDNSRGWSKTKGME